jgi:hypothetical protein
MAEALLRASVAAAAINRQRMGVSNDQCKQSGIITLLISLLEALNAKHGGFIAQY